MINRVATFILIDPHHLVLLTSCTRTKNQKKNRVNLNVPLEAASTKTSVNKDVGVESVTFSGKTVHIFCFSSPTVSYIWHDKKIAINERKT